MIIKTSGKAYIAIPTRPPAEKWVKPAEERSINEAFQIFAEKLGNDKVEMFRRPSLARRHYKDRTFS